MRMNWNASATTSTPSTLLSLTAIATFTNDSPHTMMVNAPSRSTRWGSSSAGNAARRPDAPDGGQDHHRQPDRDTGHAHWFREGCDHHEARSRDVFQHRELARERRVGPTVYRAARQYIAATVPTSSPYVRARYASSSTTPGARLHGDEHDEEHLQQEEDAVSEVGHAEAVGEDRRRQPHPPDRGEHGHDHPMRAPSCRCDTAELNTRMAATKTRS